MTAAMQWLSGKPTLSGSCRILLTSRDGDKITSATGAGLLLIFKAYKQAHSGLCNCLCNAGDGQKDKLVSDVIKFAFLSLLMVTSILVDAQELPNLPEHSLDYLNQLELEQQQQRPYIFPDETPQKITPELKLPPPQEFDRGRLSDRLTVQVKRIDLIGNTVFSNNVLDEIIKPYEGKLISSFDLFNLRNALTLFYVNHGYINSGAVIPDQDVSDGVIKIIIVEGKLNEIIVTGNDWLEDDYIIKRLRLRNDNILNLNVLQDQIRIFHRNRLINHVKAELVPGQKPGESVLNVHVEENRPYFLNLSFNNLRNPSVGELQGVIYGEVMNLTGYGDALSAHFSVTGGLDNGGISYSIPISVYDTKLYAFYERTDAKVIEEPFDSQDIKSTISSYGIGISQPYYISPQNKMTASMLLERRVSQTSLLGRPFSFSPGPENGKSRITVLRFNGEWLNQGASHVVAVRSTFSLGLDAFDATQHDGSIPDGQYFSWLGQFQWVQRVAGTELTLLLRSDLQLTPDALLPMEKFGVGGYYSVRGYRENQLVRDNGWVSSIEARYPLFRLPIPGLRSGPGDGPLELAVFYDFGWSENTDQFTRDPRTISSVGVGLRWDPHPRIHSELYWGYALRNIDNPGEDSLQDAGVQFVLDVKMF